MIPSKDSHLPTTYPTSTPSSSTNIIAKEATTGPAFPPPPAPIQPTMLSITTVEEMLVTTAKIRVARPVDQVYFLSVVAGIWLGFGAIGAFSAAAGVPESVRTEWPIIPKFLMGAVFAFALHFIVIFGGELFTGCIMIFSVGLYNRAINPFHTVINIAIVYVGNWSGCLIMAYFVAYLGRLFDDPSSRNWLHVSTLSKLEGHGWGVLFLRGIGANSMIMAIWFPVVVFVISGYEHCVANMFFLSTGLMYGAPSTIGRLWFNQSAAVVGNIVGGAIVIGLNMHLMNNWVSPISLLIDQRRKVREEKNEV